MPAIKWLGFVSPPCDLSIFREMAGRFSELDFDVYFRTLKGLADYDAWEVLEKITVPTLICTADGDLMTPMSVAEAMHRRIPESEFFVFRWGTHYAPVEYHECLNLRVEKFLLERIQAG